MTARRRLRQRQEVLRSMGAGDVDRALALALDHLADFPDDEVVAGVAAACSRGQEALGSP